MKKSTMAVLTSLGAAGAWCLALKPRVNHPGWDSLSGVRYAHRGLHNLEEGRPENSLAAFRAAVERGFGAELDVHLMSDGKLAVVHDSNLKRVCGKSVHIEDLTAEDLPDYPLQDTAETIPLLEDVLALFEGKTPLVVELKVERGNADELTDTAMSLLRRWNGTYCIESFHPAVLLRLKEKYPNVIRGQLSTNFMIGKALPLHQRIIMTYLLTTGLTKPDFIAYSWQDRGNISLRLMKKLYNVHEVAWTVRDRDTMEMLDADGVTSIFEKFVP